MRQEEDNFAFAAVATFLTLIFVYGAIMIPLPFLYDFVDEYKIRQCEFKLPRSETCTWVALNNEELNAITEARNQGVK
jgi:hypothetical protein